MSPELRTPSLFAVGPAILDVLLPADPHLPVLARAGGSAANVACILSAWGWDAHLFTTVGDDAAGECFLADVGSWRVGVAGARRAPGAETYVVVERVVASGDDAMTQFSRHCQVCGTRRSHLSLDLTGDGRAATEQPDVVFCDSATSAAEAFAAKFPASLLWFEPNHLDDAEAFRRLAARAAVVKHSQERGAAFLTHVPDPVPLHIETLGGAGLRFRLRGGEWRHLEAARCVEPADTCGAGDWLTAEVVRELVRSDSAGEWKPEKVEAALERGQATAAGSCRYFGARGMLHAQPLEPGHIHRLNEPTRGHHFAQQPELAPLHRQALQRFCGHGRTAQ